MALPVTLPTAGASLLQGDTKQPSHPFYNWCLAIDKAVRSGALSVDVAEALIADVVGRVTTLEGVSGQALLDAMYGTNGIEVLGSIASGVEIRGSIDGDAILASIIFGG